MGKLRKYILGSSGSQELLSESSFASTSILFLCCRPNQAKRLEMYSVWGWQVNECRRLGVHWGSSQDLTILISRTINRTTPRTKQITNPICHDTGIAGLSLLLSRLQRLGDVNGAGGALARMGGIPSDHFSTGG